MGTWLLLTSYVTPVCRPAHGAGTLPSQWGDNSAFHKLQILSLQVHVRLSCSTPLASPPCGRPNTRCLLFMHSSPSATTAEPTQGQRT